MLDVSPAVIAGGVGGAVVTAPVFDQGSSFAVVSDEDRFAFFSGNFGDFHVSGIEGIVFVVVRDAPFAGVAGVMGLPDQWVHR